MSSEKFEGELDTSTPIYDTVVKDSKNNETKTEKKEK